MADKVTASEFNTFATRYNTVKGSVTFPDSSGLDLGVVATVTQGQVCRKASLSELRRAVNAMETKFSNNCNCLSNPDCCQSCQTSTCQSQTCQSQSCQTATCQSQTCQSDACQTCKRCEHCQYVYNCGNSH